MDFFSVVYFVSNYTSANYKLGQCDCVSRDIAVDSFENGLCHPNFLAFLKCTLHSLTPLRCINKIYNDNLLPFFFA